ncbi:AAA family ATPase [Methylobacterium sp. A54F]
MQSEPPRCTILGGPNGAGKSTFFDAVRPLGTFVNADEVARRLDPEAPERASLAAGRAVLAQLDALLRERADFVYETTLSSRQALALMQRAGTHGYEVGLIFVALADPLLNIRRIAERVARGGHHIPEATVRRRHATAFHRLAEAIPLADGSVVYDNTGAEPERLLQVRGRAILQNALVAGRPLHERLARPVGRALGLDPACLLAPEP